MEVYAAVYDRALNVKRAIAADIVDENSYLEFLNEAPVYFYSGYLRVPKSNSNRNLKQIICILALLLMSVTTTKAQTSTATPYIRGKRCV